MSNCRMQMQGRGGRLRSGLERLRVGLEWAELKALQRMNMEGHSFPFD